MKNYYLLHTNLVIQKKKKAVGILASKTQKARMENRVSDYFVIVTWQTVKYDLGGFCVTNLAE